MSSLEVPPPDVMVGDDAPYTGFGKPIKDETAEHNFAIVLEEATRRVREGFEVETLEGRRGIEAIDGLIHEMWTQGWDPSQGDVNLFTRDFGSLVFVAIWSELEGERVFRSTTDLSHASLIWRTERLEAFPFHKVYKRLTNQQGDSLIFFLAALQERLRR